MRILQSSFLALVLLLATPVYAAEQGDFEFSSRDEIPAIYKWDFSLFYPDWEAWEADLVRMEELYGQAAAYEGRLHEGAETLLEVMQLFDTAGMVSTRLYGYAGQRRDIDTRDNFVRGQVGKLLAVYSKASANLSWLSPEVLTIPKEKMVEWIDSTPDLEPYRFGLMDTYRTGEYTLDADGEKLLSLHSKVRRTASEIFSSLTNADGARPEVTLSDGTTVIVTPGLYSTALNTYRNPEDRRAVQTAWMEQYQDRQNTFASIYEGVLNKGWALAESRGYESTLEMELNHDNVPVEVVESLVDAARDGAAALQRYHQLRQRLLGLESYGWSDMFVTLLEDTTIYDYDEVMPLIVDSVEPLGEEYSGKMAEQFTAGFVDVFETPGKRSGAYNAGRYGIGSFVLLNYRGTLDDVFTVAHEMGHSMHTRLSQEYQPYATHRYTIFVAEVAAILNEKLLLRKFLETVDNPRQRIAFLEAQIEKIKGTYFLQTMMADFEIQAHKLVESGEGISSDKLTELWKSVVQTYHGDVIPEDDPYMFSWARIPHLYNSPFYVYQYATCYASAAYLMKQMDSDPEATVERYLTLLKSGGNDYPMNQLKKAGVDLSNEDILQAVVEEFDRLADLLESEYLRYLESEG